MVSGQYATRRDEAYNVINTSEDEVFQTNLYDWYLAQNQSDRLLQVQSPYVAIYLERKSSDDVRHANLLWEYYANANRYHDAAVVQLALAKSAFALPLDKRIEYLSRAKANASAYAPGVGRQPRQLLLHEVSDLLEVASIQDDLLQRLKADPRGTRERKLEIANELDGPTLSLTEVSNSASPLVASADKIFQALQPLRRPSQLFRCLHPDLSSCRSPQPRRHRADVAESSRRHSPGDRRARRGPTIRGRHREGPKLRHPPEPLGKHLPDPRARASAGKILVRKPTRRRPRYVGHGSVLGTAGPLRIHLSRPGRHALR